MCYTIGRQDGKPVEERTMEGPKFRPLLDMLHAQNHDGQYQIRERIITENEFGQQGVVSRATARFRILRTKGFLCGFETKESLSPCQESREIDRSVRPVLRALSLRGSEELPSAVRARTVSAME